ncbi:hypothetical protein B9Z55_008146 [Caenorhabditis nigoni]|uniref:C2H2-type domain-containing protein n=1 Tax=Caenorhabditis nigoni TaxID=1611254 RepID=A0A2G5VCT8_9PELO|nr:hypothetical protein B9Z55_008146 [Caenorhabditis nigoni]
MHIWNHWDNNGQPFPCVLKGCPRQFPTIHHLRSHLKKYHRLCYWKDHYCKVCRDKHSDPDKMLSHYYWEHVRNAPTIGPVRNQQPSTSQNALSNLVIPEYGAIPNFPTILLNNGPYTSAPTPTNVPAHNQPASEPSTSLNAASDPLIPENNPFLTILKYLLDNMKPTNSYLSHLPEHVLQISPEKGIHLVHRSEALQIQVPEIDPALIQSLLDQFRASNS